MLRIIGFLLLSCILPFLFFPEAFKQLCHNIGQTFSQDDKPIGKLSLCSEPLKSCDTNTFKIIDLSRQIIGLKADVLD